MSNMERTLCDTMKMLEVAAGILSDNAAVLYGGTGQYDTFVSQMRERAKELGQLAGLPHTTS